MTSFLKASASALVLASFLAAPASAADVYGKGSTKDDGEIFDAPNVVNWSGIYIGGRAGGNLGTLDLGFSERDGDTFENTGSVDGLGMSGWTGGGQAGFDIARGRFLFGVFGGYDWSNSEVSITGVDLNPSGSSDTLSLDSDETYSITKDSEWSVGARAGFIAAPRTLVYVLAAYTEADFTASFTGQDDSEETLSGITVGGGVELAVAQNVFVGLEATHTFYDDHAEVEGDYSGADRVEMNLDETKVMGTLKLKLNTGLGGF